MLVFQTDRLAAVRAKIWTHDVKSSAIVTENFCRIERINLDFRAAILTIGAEMFQSFQISAFALPVADLIFDKFEHRGFAEIREGVAMLRSCVDTTTRTQGSRFIEQTVAARRPLRSSEPGETGLVST